MTRPYSEDLRERALMRSDAGDTDRAIAEVLSISPSCLSKWRKLRRETGALQPGKMAMPFGTPGGDVQTQAMLQVFLNINLFGMEPQEAVEAPRVASYSFPSSFEPHAYHPGRLNLENRIDKSTGEALARLGHKVEWWPEWTWMAGAVCTTSSLPSPKLNV